jgi:hypothetical protein
MRTTPTIIGDTEAYNPVRSRGLSENILDTHSSSELNAEHDLSWKILTQRLT